MNDIVKKARADEQEAAENRLRIIKDDYEKQLERLRQELSNLNEKLASLTQSLAEKDSALKVKDSVISDREMKVASLEAEVKRLQNLISQNGLESSELANRLA